MRGRPVDHASLGQFFVRRLKDGARTFDRDPATLPSPVDCLVQANSPVESGHVVEAKGRTYPIRDLLAGVGEDVELEGGHQLTLYLGPKDYHRITPLDARLVGAVPMRGERHSASRASSSAGRCSASTSGSSSASSPSTGPSSWSSWARSSSAGSASWASTRPTAARSILPAPSPAARRSDDSRWARPWSSSPRRGSCAPRPARPRARLRASVRPSATSARPRRVTAAGGAHRTRRPRAPRHRRGAARPRRARALRPGPRR